uniref:Uncharacterized protein n=1 Tax=Ditylenchus dipsaci TaxID=166011 RepID=A0A915DYM8_9BILA
MSMPAVKLPLHQSVLIYRISFSINIKYWKDMKGISNAISMEEFMAKLETSTPVFAHPLLKNFKPKRAVSNAIEEASHPDLVDATIYNKTEDVIDQQNFFLDPLGAASSTVVLENGLGKGCNGVAAHSKASDHSSIGLDEVTSRSPSNWVPTMERIETRSVRKVHYKRSSQSGIKFSEHKGQNFQEKKRSLNDKELGDLKKVLCHKWRQEKRIDCIKLMTEVARCLSTISTPQFYPAQFVHITDLLDFFGNLQTRITARNWFGKIAEIRELIPRIYVECALLRCMNFMDQSAISANVMRLCALAKSVQHPLISSFVRCYICRISMRLNAADRAPAWKCLNDWMQTYTLQPTCLLWPAMQYIIQLPEKRPIILCSMLSGVSYIYLAEHALEACRIVTGCEQVTASLKEYIHCCDIWIEFVAKYFTMNELQIILESIIHKLLPDKKYEFYYSNLVSILRKILSHIDDISVILNMDIFPQFIDIFREESVRMQSSSLVLNALISRHSLGHFSDINLAHQVMDVCKRLNESIAVSTSESEIDRVSQLIQSSVDRFDLKADPEQALTFYVGCRAALLNNDQLQKFTILKIMALALYVVRSVKFSTSRSTFIQACIANLFITIPSLRDPIQRLNFSIQSAQLALASLAFLQVDSFVNFCLETSASCLPAVPSISNNWCPLSITSYPGAQHGCTNLLQNFTTFLNTVKDYQWPSDVHADKASLLMHCLQHVFVMARISNGTSSTSMLPQFQWTSASAAGQQFSQQHCYELVEEVVDLLQPCLQDETIAMKFLEIVSLFSTQQLLSQNVQSEAKDCFKRCKRSPLMTNRIKMLKMDANL